MLPSISLSLKTCGVISNIFTDSQFWLNHKDLVMGISRVGKE